jgi:type VI protein secretion system component VasK
METINHIVNSADMMFDRLPQQITPIILTALVASVIILSVLFTVQNRLVQTFGTIAFFAAIGVLILSAPNYAMVLFALWCGLVGVVGSRKRSDLLQKQLDKLRGDVRELELAENRRFLQLINSRPRRRKHQQDAPSIMPSEKPVGINGG